MGERGHTSRSKLNLRDGITRKQGMVHQDPDISKDCHENAEKCIPQEPNAYQRIMGEYPKPVRTFGPKQAEALSQYRTSAIIYGVATILATIYVCEWRAVLQYLPFYSGKYKKDE